MERTVNDGQYTTTTIDKEERTEGDEVLGTFNVNSGRLRVTDPCYTREVWGAGILENVANGTWQATVTWVDDMGFRVSRLRIELVDRKTPKLNEHTALFNVGVDSGQAGFFDEDKYPIEEGEFEYTQGTFYFDVCKTTTKAVEAHVRSVHNVTGEVNEFDMEYDLPSAGIYKDWGAVCSTGYGDGSYNCRFFTDEAGKVVAAEIDFLVGDYYWDGLDEDDDFE